MEFLPFTPGNETEEGFINSTSSKQPRPATPLLSGGDCGPNYVAIVTPYATQVQLLQRMTINLVFRPPYVEVSSTDDFQGRQKEVVVAQIAIGGFETEYFVSLNATELLVNEERNGDFCGFIGNHSPLRTFFNGRLVIINILSFVTRKSLGGSSWFSLVVVA